MLRSLRFDIGEFNPNAKDRKKKYVNRVIGLNWKRTRLTSALTKFSPMMYGALRLME
jgi:hypothetical protein